MRSRAAPGACQILNLRLSPINLNLLGLVVRTNQINVRIDAVPGAGNLLGNLLCAITNLLNPRRSRWDAHADPLMPCWRWRRLGRPGARGVGATPRASVRHGRGGMVRQRSSGGRLLSSRCPIEMIMLPVRSEAETASTGTFLVQPEARGAWEVRDAKRQVLLSGLGTATEAELAARRLAGNIPGATVLVRDRYCRVHALGHSARKAGAD